MRRILRTPLGRFKVSRYGLPIEQVAVSKSVSTGITYDSIAFPLWEAAIAAGATLDELARLDSFPVKFQARLIAWHQKHELVAMHRQDAATKASEKR